MSEAAGHGSESLGGVPLVVHEATRSLLWIQSPRDARRAAIDLVRSLGGEVVDAGGADPTVVPIDISFGEGHPLVPSVPTGSPARELIERHLGPFALDARQVLELVGRAERLAASASTDVLTGLMNRRMLDRALGRLRHDETVIIVDLDHFKTVNDEHGHAAGDDVLRSFGSVVGSGLRGRDLVGRYGGEEFVLVVAPPSDPDALLERLREAWVAARPLPVTFSAGLARSNGDVGDTLRRADEALYRAKRAGRDRWAWAEQGQPQAASLAGSYVDPYLDDAIIGNRQPAVRIALDLLDSRVPQERIVEDLLAAAQREVGERWFRNELSPADEHLASGVTGAALDALAAETAAPTRDGLVVVACAEGDWHSLSAQMFGEALRGLGFDVTVLGGSTPSAAVAGFLARAGGEVLAVSCNLPIFFPGAVSLINAAHAMGIPVIVGGRAFGADERRATTLGADAWAADAAGAGEILARWREHPPETSGAPGALDEVGLSLFARSTGLASDALAALIGTFPPVAAYTEEQLARTQEDLAYTVQFLAAAILGDDDTVFDEFLDWLHELLLTRGVPTPALLAGLRALVPQVGSVDRSATRLLEAGIERVGAAAAQTAPDTVQ